jgi:hypothetical protein
MCLLRNIQIPTITAIPSSSQKINQDTVTEKNATGRKKTHPERNDNNPFEKLANISFP